MANEDTNLIIHSFIKTDTYGMEKMIHENPELGPDLVLANLDIMREAGEIIPSNLLALEKLITK